MEDSDRVICEDEDEDENEDEKISYDTLTDEQKNAFNRIKNGDNILIMGQGGSGKSYLINAIRDEKTLCLAPTGMAALNMNDEARTIHSILQIGEKSLLAWNWRKVKDYIENKKSSLKRFFDQYDLIVIDEGSMIISGLFTTLINTFHLIYETDSSILFNGKQIIFLMDPLQLPCIKPSSLIDDTHYISDLEESNYIINNSGFKELFNKRLENIIHFKSNKRCEDEEWNDVLSACRTGFKECSPEEKDQKLRILNQKRVYELDCIDVNGGSPTYPEDNDNDLIKRYNENIKTTLRNIKVQEINNKGIKKLEEKRQAYTTKRKVLVSKADFIKKNKGVMKRPGKIYNKAVNDMDGLGSYYAFKINNKFQLNFKVIKGERVMLRTNSVHPKLKNGSLGFVKDIIMNDEEIINIIVDFDNLDGLISIEETTFKHAEISDITVDAFPLIPAFAITIHKLQGQTIKNPLFINYNDIPWKEKQYHLLYTAISRCKEPDHVHIISDNMITEDHFPVDPVMYQWYCDNK